MVVEEPLLTSVEVEESAAPGSALEMSVVSHPTNEMLAERRRNNRV